MKYLDMKLPMAIKPVYGKHYITTVLISAVNICHGRFCQVLWIYHCQ